MQRRLLSQEDCQTRSQRHFDFAAHRVEQISPTADSSFDVYSLKSGAWEDAKGHIDICVTEARIGQKGKDGCDDEVLAQHARHQN